MTHAKLETLARLRLRVGVLIDSSQSLEFTSYVHSGLASLARAGAIDLAYRIARDRDERDLVRDPIILCLTLRRGTEPLARLLACDFNDANDYVSAAVAERCDAYFKRNYCRPALNRCDARTLAKVAPLGFVFPCANVEAKMRVTRAIGPALIGRGRDGLRALRNFLALAPPDAWRQGPDHPVTQSVVFQTRLWANSEAPAREAAALNASRVDLVRALRDAFGERFVGGLMPTPLAQERFGELISPHPSNRRLYMKMRKQQLVGVCTAGLQESTPFKWAECLATSQCIVAVPLRNELPVPVEAGRHYLPFTTPADCVDACRRLLADPRGAAAMRRENHEYFQAEVEPAARVARLLLQAAA